MSGNIYQFNGFAFSGVTEKIFNPNGKVWVDGGIRVRSKNFTIKNVDSTAILQYSFDGTTYSSLDTYESYSNEMMTDRYFVKAQTGDYSCQFVVLCGLNSSW